VVHAHFSPWVFCKPLREYLPKFTVDKPAL
jgi:hypothetical protein